MGGEPRWGDAVLVRVFQETEPIQELCLERESYLKALANIVMEAGECKVCRVGRWAGDLGKS